MMTTWKSVLCGTVGGLAGAWAMQQFRKVWDDRAGASPESGIFGFDEEADLNSVDELCNVLSLAPLSKEEALRAALVLHYAYGAVAGGAYGAMDHKFPAVSAGFGTLFGASLWLIGDELAMTASGLSDPASKVPSSHLSALFAHLLFGSVTELSRRILSDAVD